MDGAHGSDTDPQELVDVLSSAGTVTEVIWLEGRTYGASGARVGFSGGQAHLSARALTAFCAPWLCWPGPCAAYVYYTSTHEAEAAVRALHGRPVSRRPLQVMGLAKLARFLVRSRAPGTRYVGARAGCGSSHLRPALLVPLTQAAEGEDASFVFMQNLPPRISEDDVRVWPGPGRRDLWDND